MPVTHVIPHTPRNRPLDQSTPGAATDRLERRVQLLENLVTRLGSRIEELEKNSGLR
jgi:hypothetical protein